MENLTLQPGNTKSSSRPQSHHTRGGGPGAGAHAEEEESTGKVRPCYAGIAKEDDKPLRTRDLTGSARFLVPDRITPSHDHN